MLSVDVSRGRLRARWLFVRALALLVALVAVSGNSFAGQVKLAWDPVAQATGYRVHYGTSSGNYASSVDAQNQTTVTVPGLTDGMRYYFAVKAYNGTTTSDFSPQINTVAQASAPVASFAASPTTGVAPLVVSLTDTSSGSITSRSWNLGDGTAATTQAVAKTYSKPGTYAVTLTVTGSGGSATASRSISVAAAPVTPAPTPAPPPAPTPAPPPGTSTPGTPPAPGTGSTATNPIAPHTRGLVAAYGFEEPSGSEVIDASGNANKGTVSGATRIATDHFGRALKFDGKDDWVTVNATSRLNLTTAMTLEAWVFPTTTSGVRDILIKEGSTADIYNLYARNWRGRPESNVFLGGKNRVAEGTALPANRWTHVAGTYDGTTLRLFINGVQTASTPMSGPIATSTGPLRIGGNSLWGEFFQGYIDEVRIYNRALTQPEIFADLNTAVVGLVLSKSPDRSNPVPLNGLAVSGNIYVHYQHISRTAAPNPVKQVAFWLDNPNPTDPSGPPRRIERQPAYDFEGTGGAGAAIGFDTTGLSKGIHIITARVTLMDGTVLPLINGSFTIQEPGQ
jgi:PKD repeat protein